MLNKIKILIIISLVIFIIFKLTLYNVVEKKRKKLNISYLQPPINLNEIPKKIFQCYKSRDKVPNYVFDNLKNTNSNYDYNFFDDNKCIQFLEENYGENLVNKFKSCKKGAHKADLWRYCVLYKFGGVYIDIDVNLTEKLDNILRNKNIKLCVPVTYNWFFSTFGSNNIFNAVIMCTPRNKIMYECIKKFMETPNIEMEYDYFIHLKNFDKILEKYLNISKIKPGIFKDVKILQEYFMGFPYKWGIYDYELNKHIGFSKYDDYGSKGF